MGLQAFATVPSCIYLGSGGLESGPAVYLDLKSASGILLVVLETDPRVLLFLGKGFTTDLHLQPWNILHRGMVE